MFAPGEAQLAQPDRACAALRRRGKVLRRALMRRFLADALKHSGAQQCVSRGARVERGRRSRFISPQRASQSVARRAAILSAAPLRRRSCAKMRSCFRRDAAGGVTWPNA